jgi:hypothetical protein
LVTKTLEGEERKRLENATEVSLMKEPAREKVFVLDRSNLVQTSTNYIASGQKNHGSLKNFRDDAIIKETLPVQTCQTEEVTGQSKKFPQLNSQ